MYAQALLEQLLPFYIQGRESKRGRNIFVPDREKGSVLPVEDTNDLPVSDHDISQIEIAMAKHIWLAFWQAVLQVLQNLLGEVVKFKSQGIPELLVRVKWSLGFEIEKQ
jgi:hypothetical protein